MVRRSTKQTYVACPIQSGEPCDDMYQSAESLTEDCWCCCVYFADDEINFLEAIKLNVRLSLFRLGPLPPRGSSGTAALFEWECSTSTTSIQEEAGTNTEFVSCSNNARRVAYNMW